MKLCGIVEAFSLYFEGQYTASDADSFDKESRLLQKKNCRKVGGRLQFGVGARHKTFFDNKQKYTAANSIAAVGKDIDLTSNWSNMYQVYYFHVPPFRNVFVMYPESRECHL